MAKDLKAFLKKITEDSAFAEEAKAKGKSIAEAEKISDDKELTVRVGKEMGYEFTVVDINKIELDIEKKESEKSAAMLKEKLNEKFELDPEVLGHVAGGCNDTFDPHNWEFVGKEEGILWGYNLRFRCSKCGDEKTEWEKWPWED